ncbi:hypothetical protein [Gemmata sp.]|uniref:hypothetical protein n=1 Tax=Gemmata sp. TaxID=1914242 RepID=UPI003F6FDF9D
MGPPPAADGGQGGPPPDPEDEPATSPGHAPPDNAPGGPTAFEVDGHLGLIAQVLAGTYAPRDDDYD